ncbi:hypothetical protein D3C81_2251240 [compost metagenome]
MLAEEGGGDEGQAQAGAIGEVLPGQVFAGLGVDDGVGQGQTRCLSELRVQHGDFLFRCVRKTLIRR